MQRTSRTISVLAVVAAVSAVIVVPALASASPSVTRLSAHRGPYWGGTSLTVRGANFTGVESVTFGHATAWNVQVVSPTELVAVVPHHSYAQVYVRVTTTAGRSPRSSAAVFTYTRPSMNDPIQGGLTGHQEQHLSAQVRARHREVHVARGSKHWTPAMGRTALNRAESWIGVPYSWAGGDGNGPTKGVCAHNGGDLDCHVVGFDCSGLTLYSWWPYEHLEHLAATQHHQAGRFHPSIRQLVPGDLVYFSGYIADGIGHTAIYAGKGMVIQAPESGEQVMRSTLGDVIADSGVYRGATRPMTAGRQGAGPHVASVTRSIAATGGTFTITGRGLAGVTSVSVGHSIIYTVEHRSDGRLVVQAPAHTAGRVRVAVSNAWGTVRRTTTYVAAPESDGLSPAAGPTAGRNVVTIHGRDLSRATTATLDGTRVGLDVLSATRATITMPRHRAGTVRIVLRSAYGTSTARTYTYTAPLPTPTPTRTAPPTSAPPTTSVAPTTTAPPTAPSTSSTAVPSTTSAPASSTPASSTSASASSSSATPSPSPSPSG